MSCCVALAHVPLGSPMGWDDYFYPGTDTLRNKWGELDPTMLHAMEYQATRVRHRELVDGTATVPRDFGPDHIKGIHGYLFQDVYQWAGQYRDVGMVKMSEPGGIGFTAPGQIDLWMRSIQDFVRTTTWQSMDAGEFVEAASVTFAHLNQAHPFREGNGRASKIYMQHVAELSPFRLDFSGIDPMLWNLSSELSRPSLLRQTVDARFLYHVFATATRPATQAPPAAPQQGVGPRSASYPRAATAAPQQPQLNKPAGYTPRQSHRGQGRVR